MGPMINVPNIYLKNIGPKHGLIDESKSWRACSSPSIGLSDATITRNLFRLNRAIYLANRQMVIDCGWKLFYLKLRVYVYYVYTITFA